jgi:dihydrofolate reductase
MISIIAAIGKNRELGKDNKLLWHIPEDMERFKKLTTGQVVIMGRKTYQSLPKKFQPLPSRVNIVVTRNHAYTPLGCVTSNSIEEAIKKAKEFDKEIFIIGGASIYQQGIKYADRLYLTLVNKEFTDADAFFPDYSEFKKKLFQENHQDKNYSYQFVELIK